MKPTPYVNKTLKLPTWKRKPLTRKIEPNLRNHFAQVARLPNSLVIAAGSPGADSVEMLAETGWTVREGTLRTPRQDSASVTVDVKHFPECQ